MKQGKRLSRNQREHLAALGFNPFEWLLCKQAKGIWTLEHTRTLELKEVEAPR